MLYLDLLDTTRVANGGDEKIHWWRPSSISQQRSLGLAEAGIMSRLLMGNTIATTNNQITDSVSLLKLIPRLYSLSNACYPPLIANFYGKDLEKKPSSLIKIAHDYFSSDIFLSSAWSPLPKDKSNDVAANIRLNNDEKTVFRMMFSGISLEEPHKDKFQELAKDLQFLYDYLVFWETKNNSACGKAEPTKPEHQRSIWNNIKKLENHDSGWGISEDYITKIWEKLLLHPATLQKGIAVTQESRSVLYDVLGEAVNNEEDRDWIKSYIDIFYNSKLADSSSGGVGLFTISSPFSPLNLDYDLRRVILSDIVDPIDLAEMNVGIQITPYEEEEIAPIGWDDINSLWANPDYIKLVSELNMQKDVVKKLTQKNYENSQSDIEKYETMINTFTEFLGQQIGKGKVKESKENGLLKYCFYLTEFTFIAADTAAAYLIARVIEDYETPYKWIPLLAFPLEKILSGLLKKVTNQAITTITEAAVVGQIRSWFSSWQ